MACYSSLGIGPNLAWSTWHQLTSLLSWHLVPNHSIIAFISIFYFVEISYLIIFTFRQKFLRGQNIACLIHYLVSDTQNIVRYSINISLMNERTYYFFLLDFLRQEHLNLCYKYNFYIKHMRKSVIPHLILNSKIY